MCAAAVVAAVVFAVLVGPSSASARATAAVRVSVGGDSSAQAVPASFVGISSELKNLFVYGGKSASNLDTPFIALVRGLSPSSPPLLRLAGDSSDWTWWPVPGMRQPRGVTYSLTPAWAALAKAVASSLDGNLLVGINLEANSSRIASYEVRQLSARLGSTVAAYELGNEPELYSSFSWYRTARGTPVYGRPSSYDVSAYTRNFWSIAETFGAVPLAGPATGSPTWFAGLRGFLRSAHHRLSMVTVHAYPLKHCAPSDTNTTSALFEPESLQGLVARLRPSIAAARQYHVPVRIDELNAVTCGGENGVSNTFASALWAIEVLPLLERAGVGGVNFHTVPGGAQQLIGAADHSTGWRVSVFPEYYGMLAFAQAAPTGAHFLDVSAGAVAGLTEWATRGTDGTVHVVIVNASSAKRTISLSVRGASAPATATTLEAPSLDATRGVTFGGQTISPTTGTLAGASTATTVAHSGGGYVVAVPRSSAVIVTIPS